MSTENMSLPIPNAVLEPYIKTAVSAAIAGALGDGVSVIEKAVQQALMIKVDAEGKHRNSDYYDKYPLIEYLAAEKIREFTKLAVSEMAEQMRPQITESVKKLIAKKGSTIANTLVDGMIESLKTTWAVTVEVEPQEKSRY